MTTGRRFVVGAAGSGVGAAGQGGRMPSRQPSSSSQSPLCSIVPPYVLEALAASGDPYLAAHAQATLAVDREETVWLGQVAGTTYAAT